MKLKLLMSLVVVGLLSAAMSRAADLIDDVKYIALGKLRWGEFLNIELLGDKEGVANGFIKFVTIESPLREISLVDETNEKIKEERLAMMPPSYCMVGFNSEKKEVALIAFSPGSLIGISPIHIVTPGIYQSQTGAATITSMDVYKKLLEAAKVLEKGKIQP